MKRILLIIVQILVSFSCLYSQIAVGEWTAFQSFGNATNVETFGNITYCLNDKNLYSFNSDDNSVYYYNKTNLLNDVKIASIKYADAYSTLIIVYENGNIDFLIKDEETYNIPYLKDTDKIGSKQVYDIFIKDKYAYISGDFGICILDIEKKEVKNTYIFETSIASCGMSGNTLFAAGKDGLYTGNINENLLDPNKWLKANANIYNYIISFDNKVYGANEKGLYLLDESGTEKAISTDNIIYASCNEDKIIFGNSNTVFLYDKKGNITSIKKEAGFLNVKYNKQKDIYWAACGYSYLNGFKISGEEFTPVYSSIVPDGPRRELFYYMNFFDGNLMIAGGKLETPEVYNPGTVMTYNGEKWSFLDEGASSYTGISFTNTTSIAIDPRDKNHIFVSSSFGGLYEFQNGSFVNLYTYYADESKKNSTLQSILPQEPEPRFYVRVDALNYDKDNNLWMTNNSSKTIINVLKNDGKWIAFNHPEIENTPNAEEMIFDQRGYIWIAMRRVKTGIFCFDYNNTIDNTNDDRTRYISNYINQDGSSLGELKTYDIVEDKKGSIWIATEKGPLVINNPASIFDNEGVFTVTQIKVPRNDGTNLADYLLKDECITAIAVDGGNRKWLGTQNSGLYLLSEDGLQTIEHFDTSNSPLFSNYIESLAINPETGELYIGTDKGLMCYRTDSSEPEETFSEEIYAFPNPVKPDYEGAITVTGLVYDTDIKITDTSGRVVASGKSIGGTFSWDGKNAYGRKVPTGIYFVMASNPEGKEGIVTKITVIR